MKKIIPYILIFITVVQLFAPFTIGSVGINKAEAADGCKFVSVKYSPPSSHSNTTPDSVLLNIVTSNCVGKFFYGMVKRDGSYDATGSDGEADLSHVYYNMPSQEITSDSFSLKLIPGETSDPAMSQVEAAGTCTKGTCETQLQLYLLDRQANNGKGRTVDKYFSKATGKDGGDDLLFFKCRKADCDPKSYWGTASVTGTNETSNFSMVPDSTKDSITISGLGPVLASEGQVSDSDTASIELFEESTGASVSVTGNPTVYNIAKDLLKGKAIAYSTTFSGLTPKTSYTAKLTVKMAKIPELQNKTFTLSGIYTRDELNQIFVPLPQAVGNRGNAQNSGDVSGLPICTSGTLGLTLHIGGCLAQGMYYLFFKPTSLFFGLAGNVLDFTLMYSISDTSYRSSFVTSGWGIVRDFCNMFFIFVMLYIAFGTILSLHGVKTKEMIVNVVIIGLLINFSLFATQVIIDASNILTRVFYNQNTIKVGTKTQKDANGNEVAISELGTFGEIPLSEAIVSKVDPQQLVLQAKKVGDIPPRGAVAGEDDDSNGIGISTGTFMVVIILATVVNIVGTIAFITSGFIFIGRVLGLWIAMILAPLAFFSYIVPGLQDLEMVGWKKWWPETLKMAFLAPVFAFFMYLIVGFLDKGLGVVDAATKNGSYGLSFIIAITVPFVFIMVLLMKAKSIATKMSGEIGAAMAKAGSAVGGLALGAATGGAAFAMRGTIGRVGNKLANAGWTKNTGAFGRTMQNAGKFVGSKSFDARNTSLGKDAAKSMGVDAGKGKEGGYTKHLSEKVEKRQKRAKELEISENEKEKQDLNKLEMDHQNLLRGYSHDIEVLDKRIVKARENSADAQAELRADPSDPAKIQAAQDAAAAVKELKAHKKAIKSGATNYVITSLTDDTLAAGATGTVHLTDDGTVAGRQNNITSTGKSINQLEDTEIPHAHSEIEKKNRDRKWKYAKAKSWMGGRANKEAAHKIRMEEKLDSGSKGH